MQPTLFAGLKDQVLRYAPDLDGHSRGLRLRKAGRWYIVERLVNGNWQEFSRTAGKQAVLRDWNGALAAMVGGKPGARGVQIEYQITSVEELDGLFRDMAQGEQSTSQKPVCTPAERARLERCIRSVKEKGGANPWAVCQESIGCRKGTKIGQSQTMGQGDAPDFLRLCQDSTALDYRVVDAPDTEEDKRFEAEVRRLIVAARAQLAAQGESG